MEKILYQNFPFCYQIDFLVFLVNVHYLGVLLSLHSEWRIFMYSCILIDLLNIPVFTQLMPKSTHLKICIDLKIKLILNILYSSQGRIWFFISHYIMPFILCSYFNAFEKWAFQAEELNKIGHLYDLVKFLYN